MKVSEWLETIDSHGIYEAAPCAADFTKETGKLPCWPTFTVAQTITAIKKRGIGGSVNGKPNERVAYGYEIANALAENLAATSSHRKYSGRGSQFRAAVEALKNAGL